MWIEKDISTVPSRDQFDVPLRRMRAAELVKAIKCRTERAIPGEDLTFLAIPLSLLLQKLGECQLLERTSQPARCKKKLPNPSIPKAQERENFHRKYFAGQILTFCRNVCKWHSHVYLAMQRNLSSFFRDKLPIRLAIDSWICFMDPKKSRNLTKATGKQINVPLYQ